MSYKCVHCSAVYKDGSDEIISGCTGCKSKFFFYIKEEKLKEIETRKKTETDFITSKEKRQMEKDVREIAGIKDNDAPVFLDFESVKIFKPGKYLIDLQKLFDQKKPKVYKLEDGKYIIDLSVFSAEK